MTQSHPSSPPEDTGNRDAEWVRAAVAGDSAAFSRLVEAYQRRAVGVAYRLLSNSDDAQEVAQEAFIRAYRSLDRLNEPNRFGPWLMRIVSNLSLNFRRSRRSSGPTARLDEHQGVDGATTPDGRPVLSMAGPESEAQGRELQGRIDEALAKLPEKQRLSLLMFTVDGWAQKDIADFLECSIENVKWNVFQARKKLKELLSDDMIE